MAIYVLRDKASEGAKELAAALNGFRLKRTENGRFYRFSRRTGRMYVDVRPQDVVVCWGATIPTNIPGRGTKVLNGGPLRNKFTDVEILTTAGVPTVEVSRTRPQARQAPAPVDPAVAAFVRAKELAEEFSNIEQFSRNRPFIQGADELMTAVNVLVGTLRQPAPVAPPAQPVGDWVGRTFNHTGGLDLLRPPAAPDYWVKKLELVKEFRVHSFQGKSIRAGIKSKREDFHGTLSPWVRSWDGGWRIKYDGVSSKKKHRELAHKAVAALGLQFGAVDIGQKADGSLVVLEVNRAPGISDGTTAAYAAAIQRWLAETR